MAKLEEWPSYPQVLQRYVPGSDVHFSFLANRGEIVAWEAHEPLASAAVAPGRGFRFLHDDRLVDIGRRLATSATPACTPRSRWRHRQV